MDDADRAARKARAGGFTTLIRNGVRNFCVPHGRTPRGVARRTDAMRIRKCRRGFRAFAPSAIFELRVTWCHIRTHSCAAAQTPRQERHLRLPRFHDALE